MRINFYFQFFPNGDNKTSAPNNYDSIISAFPTFKKQNYDELNIGFMSYGGMMAGKKCAFS